MPHVFISYVRENTETVDRLYRDLDAHGISVWLDRNHILPGIRWRQAIRRAIRQGNFFIACFSKEYNSRAKTYMNEEITLAIEELRQRPADKTWFIPAKVSECEIPDRDIGAGETLQDLHYVELYRDWEAGIQCIVEVIKPLPSEVQRLVEALQSDSVTVRISAAEVLRNNEVLRNTGDARIISVLTAALRDENKFVRYEVAAALGGMGELVAVPILIEALNEDEEPRYVAEYTLRRMGETVVPSLVKSLSNDNKRIRRLAAYAFTIIQSSVTPLQLTQAIPSLKQALTDEDDQIRSIADDLLRWIGTPEALEALELYDHE